MCHIVHGATSDANVDLSDAMMIGSATNSE
jgi:hypothetical protein